MNKPPVICLDGPSGVGKGTICLLVARHLHWHILDSGSLYRLTALQASREGVADDEYKVAQIAQSLAVEYREQASELKIYLNNTEVNALIRTETVGSMASKIAAMPAVRQALLARQRAFLQMPGLVADGRDMGTVVFPEAPLKIYLTATPEERAKRRYKQLKGQGIDGNLCDLIENLRLRDERDMNRTVAPLRPATDAIIIDTTEYSINDVSSRVMKWVKERIETTSC